MPKTAAQSDAPRPIAAHEIIGMLGASVGEDKARKALEEAVQTLGLSEGPHSRDDALALLGHIAETPGVVGVCARFSRSRLMMEWVTHDLSGALAGRRRQDNV